MITIILCPFSKKVVNLNRIMEKVKVNYLIITKKKNVQDFSNCNVLGINNYFDDYELEEIISDIHVKFKIDKIISISEKDIIRASKLRDRFIIDGQNMYSALLFKDKYLMKNNLMKNPNIKLPKFANVESLVDVSENQKRIGSPFILKPRKGTSSVGVEKFISFEDVPLNIDFSDYIIEEFIESSAMYSVDGLYYDNEILFCTAHKYGITPYSMKNTDDWCVVEQVNHTDPIYDRLLLQQKEICKSMENNSVSYGFHSEFFYNNDKDEITFCETTSRLGGALIPDLIRESFSIDLEEINLKAQLGVLTEVEINNVKNSYQKYTVASILIPKKFGIVKGFPEISDINFPWIANYIKCLSIGDVCRGKDSIIDVAAYIIIKYKDKYIPLDMYIDTLKEVFVKIEKYEN